MTGGELGGLPSGDVCFLFTDVERSTEILRAVGDERWADVLGRAQAAVTAAVREHGGVVVNVEGDGCFAAFSDPAAATEACRQAQQQLHLLDWGDGIDLRVRMGMHAGSGITPRDGDYVALAVHRAARVCAAANGGQVLATATVAARVPGTFADVGLYSVRDFDGAVRLYALEVGAGTRTAAGAAGDATDSSGHSAAHSAAAHTGAPPPRVPPAFDARLPRYDTALVGRQEEIAQIVTALQRHPVLTLTGAAGIGKTRLAVAVLSEGAPAGTAWFVDLSAVSAPGYVGDVLARAVGCPPDVDVDAHLDAVLSGRPGLLVLDHCDQLRAQAAAVAGLLRDWNPTLRIVCTAREPLGMPREAVVDVAPLGGPGTEDPAEVLASGAGRLFLERAQRAIGDPELPHAVAPDALRICRATNGNPLALELVAAMCADGPVRTVTSAAEAAGDSIAALVDAVSGRLAGSRRIALAALAVPAQPVPHHVAVAAVAAAGVADPDQSVAELLHRYLLVRTDEDGYRLPSAVRDRLAGDPGADVRQPVLVGMLAECLARTAEPPVPVTAHDGIGPVAAALVHESDLPAPDRQRLAAQLVPWWTGRLGGPRTRELLTEALALGRWGAPTAAVHLAVAHTFPPGTETVETERHVHEAARVLGEVDAVPAALVERLRRTLRAGGPDEVPAP